MTIQEWYELVQRHGGYASEPVVLDPQIDNPDPKAGDLGIPAKIPNPNPKRKYIFKDGTELEARSIGESTDPSFPGEGRPGEMQIVDPGTALKPPTQGTQGPTDRFPHTVWNADGSSTTYQIGKDPKTGKFAVIEDIPPEYKPASDSKKPPSDPADWRPIHANPQDPTSPVIAIMDPKTGERQAIPAGATPSKPVIYQGQGGEFVSWDGSNLVTVRGGKETPKKGDKQTAVVGGFNVEQTHDGTQWNTTKVLSPADPNAVAPGTTRPNIVGGYNVTQTKNDNDWTTTAIGSKAVPGETSVVNAPGNTPYISTIQDGKISTQPNASFMPKTPAEINARIGQLNSIAKAKQDELLTRSSADPQKYSADQAVDDFKKWWAQTIAPEQQALNNAQDQAAIEAARLGAAQRTNAVTAATGAQNASVNAFNAMQANRVGPGYGDLMAAARRGDFEGMANAQKNMTYTAPDITQTSQDAFMNAMKNISPTAAAATGAPQPDYARIDIGKALGMDQYMPGFNAPPQATPATVATPATAATPATGGMQQLDLGQSAMQGLLPAGYAGVPGFDPRFQGRLNPNNYGIYQAEDFPDPSMLGTYTYGR